MAKLSVQKSKAEKQLIAMREQLKKLNEDKVRHRTVAGPVLDRYCTVTSEQLEQLNEDKVHLGPSRVGRSWVATMSRVHANVCAVRRQAALFREVSSLEAQLAQSHADREESRNWASTYRDMLLKVT